MRMAVAVLGLAAAVPGAAQARDLCTDRPGLGTPACTVEPGKVQVETGLADWTRDSDSTMRSDTVLIGDTLIRIGVADPLELQVGWTPFGYQRDRDRIAGTTDHARRVGDVTLGLKYNLKNPDGSGFSVALRPQVTLPVGREPIGAGDWGASLVVPVSYELSDTLQLQATPEIDAAVDEDGHGRHAAYGTTVGLGITMAEKLSGAVEVQAIRDEDPGGTTTQALLGLSLGWQVSDDSQFDIGSNVGLDRDADDLELYLGYSHRF